MKFKKKIILFPLTLLVLNILNSCSSYTGSVTPPVNNQSSKEVAIGKVRDALLGNTDKEIIEKNKRLFEDNQDIDRKTKSNTDLDSDINTEELLSLLKLNPDQKKVFDERFNDYFAGKRSIMESLSMDDYEKKQKIIRISKKRDDGIMHVLDRFQLEIFKNYLHNNQY
jgi:hypothetical protein